MGFWAEVKKALNSTLGTDSFKPLNEIVEMEMYTSAVSGNTDKILATSPFYLPIKTEGNSQKKSIKLGLGGRARACLQVNWRTSENTVVSCVIQTTRSSTGGTYQKAFNISSGGVTQKEVEIFDSIPNYEAGEVLTIEAYIINPPSDSSFWISDFILRGTILPKGTIQIMED